jgi:ribosomal protein S1
VQTPRLSCPCTSVNGHLCSPPSCLIATECYALAGEPSRLGHVTKLVPFGVFVRIEEVDNGFEGLVHNSDLPHGHSDNPQLDIQVGHALLVKILDIDPVQRRITLSHRQASPEA